MGSVRNGSSLLGLPQFPSSNVELGAVSVETEALHLGAQDAGLHPDPRFCPGRRGRRRRAPTRRATWGAKRRHGACLADAGVTTSPRRDAGPCLVSVGRGAQGRTPGVGFQGRRRQEAEAESARAGRTLRISPGLVLPDGLREDGRAVSLRNHLRAVSLATPLHSTPAVGAPRRGSPRLSPVSLPPQ